MSIVILTLAFIISLLLEVTILRLPLLLILLLVVFVRRKSPNLFILAFFLGILLDILLLQRIGLSSLFFIVFLFLAYLYERKYEIDTLPFIIIATGVGAIAWAFLSNNGQFLLLQVVISILLSGCYYVLYRKLQL